MKFLLGLILAVPFFAHGEAGSVEYNCFKVVCHKDGVCDDSSVGKKLLVNLHATSFSISFGNVDWGNVIFPDYVAYRADRGTSHGSAYNASEITVSPEYMNPLKVSLQQIYYSVRRHCSEAVGNADGWSCHPSAQNSQKDIEDFKRILYHRFYNGPIEKNPLPEACPFI